MQIKSKLAVVEKQSSGSSYKTYIGLVNGEGKVADILTKCRKWNKKQVEFAKQGLQKQR